MRITHHYVGAVLNRSDVAEKNGGSGAKPDRRIQKLLNVAAKRRVGGSESKQVSRAYASGGQYGRRAINRRNHFFGRQAIGSYAIRVYADHDAALVAAKRRRRGDSRQSRENRPHSIQGDILHLAGRAVRTRENKLGHRHAASVIAHDEWRNRARRHEGARAIHVAHHFRHGLAHVSVGMKH